MHSLSFDVLVLTCLANSCCFNVDVPMTVFYLLFSCDNFGYLSSVRYMVNCVCHLSSNIYHGSIGFSFVVVAM